MTESLDPRVHTMIGYRADNRRPSEMITAPRERADLSADELDEMVSHAYYHGGEFKPEVMSDILHRYIDLASDDNIRAEELKTTKRQLAIALGQGDAYRRAFAREVKYSDHLLQLNERLRRDADQARRAQHRFLELLSESLAAAPLANVPPPEPSFDSSDAPDETRVWARGTNPDNETVVVDQEQVQ